MPVEFEVSVVRIGNSLRITIPKEIVKALGIRKGDKLGLTVTDATIAVRKL